MLWEKMKKGIVYYILHRILSPGGIKTPIVIITDAGISIDDIHEPFHDKNRRLKNISIHDAGKMNVMEIYYERQGILNTILYEIVVLIPKGRLKEAIGLEEKLNAIKNASQQD